MHMIHVHHGKFATSETLLYIIGDYGDIYNTKNFTEENF